MSPLSIRRILPRRLLAQRAPIIFCISLPEIEPSVHLAHSDVDQRRTRRALSVAACPFMHDKKIIDNDAPTVLILRRRRLLNGINYHLFVAAIEG